jgi:hypothetical protein
MLIPTGRDLTIARATGTPCGGTDRQGVDRALGGIGAYGGLTIELMLVRAVLRPLVPFPSYDYEAQIQECRSSIRRPFR